MKKFCIHVCVEARILSAAHTPLLAKNKAVPYLLTLKDSVRGFYLSWQFWRILVTASQEKSFFCCLVVRLGWGKQCLQRLSPHTWHTGNAVIPKTMEEGMHKKSLWSCVGRNTTSVECASGIPMLLLGTAGARGVAPGWEHVSCPSGFLNEPFCTHCTAL